MWRAGLLPIVLAAALAGCGGAGDAPATTATGPAPAPQPAPGPGRVPRAGELIGRSFTAITLRGRRPVAGSEVAVAFERDRLAVATGCNGLSGGWSIADGRLRTAELTQTMIGCEPRVTRQEAWLRELVESAPRIALEGSRLTLARADGSTVVLTERARPGGPPPIVGTRWRLESIVEGAGRGGSASSVPAGVEPPTLLLRADGRVDLFAGCNRGGGRARVRDDGFVVFGPLALTRLACEPDAAAVEAAVTAILDGRVAAGFEGQRLTLAQHGRALVFAPSG